MEESLEKTGLKKGRNIIEEYAMNLQDFMLRQ